jgi:hypothetical protein
MTYEQALEKLGLSPDIRLRQMFELGRLAAAAQPAVPDAITDNSESPEFRAGWNECRELTIQMGKP